MSSENSGARKESQEEARSGSVEGTLCQMVFEDGTRLEVWAAVKTSLSLRFRSL